MKWYELAIPLGGALLLWKFYADKQPKPEPEPCEPLCNIDALASLPPVEVKTQEAIIGEQMANYHAIIRAASATYNVPTQYIYAIIEIESSFNPYATGRSGEIGLMQVMSSTAEWLGYSGSLADLYLPTQNIKYGTKYLAYWINKGYSIAAMAAAYNAGDARKYDTGQYKNQAYVDKFFKALENYQR